MYIRNSTISVFRVNKRLKSFTIKFYFVFNLPNLILKCNSYLCFNSGPNQFESIQVIQIVFFCIKCGVYADISNYFTRIPNRKPTPIRHISRINRVVDSSRYKSET